MAGTSYNRLFNTRVTHTFYEMGISRNDLAVFPTEGTALAMKNSNMLFRGDEQGFRVLYRAEDNGDAFIPFSNVRLIFGIQLLNLTSFLNFTEITGYAAGKILYFNNLVNQQDNNLDFFLIDHLRAATFTYEFPQTATAPGDPTDVADIVIKDQADNIVTPAPPPPSTGIVSDQNKKYHYPVDFTKMPKGLYKFETTNVSEGAVTEYVYIDTDLARQGVFGIVDILAVDEDASNYPPFPAPTPPLPVPPITTDRVYDMNFIRRESFWRYFVVMKSGKTALGDNIRIIDPNVTPPFPYAQITFTRKADTTVNNIDAAVFTSFPNSPPTPLPGASPVPFFENPVKGIRIEKEILLPTPHFETVLENIETPSLGVVSGEGTYPNPTEIFVFI